jgi:hypothetical protein
VLQKIASRFQLDSLKNSANNVAEPLLVEPLDRLGWKVERVDVHLRYPVLMLTSAHV